MYIALTKLQSDSHNKNKEQNNTNNKKTNYRNVKRQRNAKHSERPTRKARLNGS